MKKHVSAKKVHSYQEAMTGNLIIFLCIYAIVHWLTSDEFTDRYENLIVVFAIMRIVVEFGVILPEKVRH